MYKKQYDMQIVIRCDYAVYDEEWEELKKMINGLLSGTKFSNCQAYIETKS